MARLKKINERAVLIKVEISKSDFRKKDKKASHELIQAKNIQSEKRVRVNKDTLRSDEAGLLRKVESAFQAVRLEISKHTLPWMSGGIEILPTTKYFEVRKAADAKIRIAEERLEEFLKEYNNLIQKDKEALGDLFDRADYLDASSVRAKFGIKILTIPFPEVTANNPDIRREMEESLLVAMNESQSALFDEVLELVKHFVNVIGEEGKSFKKNTIDNLGSIADKIRHANYLDNPFVEELATALETLAKLNADQLRDNDVERKRAAQSASDLVELIQENMEAFC